MLDIGHDKVTCTQNRPWIDDLIIGIPLLLTYWKDPIEGILTWMVLIPLFPVPFFWNWPKMKSAYLSVSVFQS